MGMVTVELLVASTRLYISRNGSSRRHRKRLHPHRLQQASDSIANRADKNASCD